MDTCTLFPAESGGNLSVRVKPYPATRVRPGIEWPAGGRAADGEWYGIDRGAATDAYFADVVFFGSKSEMRDLAEWLEVHGRGDFRLGQISGLVFPPHLNQSGFVSVAPAGRRREGHVFFSPGEAEGMHELAMTLRAVSPVIVDSPGSSLGGLALQPSYEADKSTEVAMEFSIDGDAHAVDAAGDAGRFVGSFRQDSESAAAVLKFLLQANRASPFDFPDLPQVDYPFGITRGGLPKKCKARSFSIARESLNRWGMKIEFVESFLS